MKLLSVPLTQSLNLTAGSFDEDEGAAAYTCNFRQITSR